MISSSDREIRVCHGTKTRDKPSIDQLKTLTRRVRYQILEATTRAGSGHPTSSLSAADLMTGLMFGGMFRYDVDRPVHPNNDRLIFSKGHASPLFYALWAAAGQVSEEAMRAYRQFGSNLEGHPMPNFPFTEAATGSLGQGLSVGLGMALNAKYLDRLPYRTWVLLGDSEMAEGSQWEAMEIAAHYRLGQLTGIIDVNRLGQVGETMWGHDVEELEKRVASFGWRTFRIDGHEMEQILDACAEALVDRERPMMILAKTTKGKGVSFLEDQDGWHGKALNQEQFKQAAEELGEVDLSACGEIPLPEDPMPERPTPGQAPDPSYDPGEKVATREAYGRALKRLYPAFPQAVSLDGEVSNSTKADIFGKAQEGRFFEMYIGEQNMVGAALGLSRRGKIPFVSTFAAFMTRAFDQIRMARYSQGNIKFVGSHAGVSIGQDGPSQMGLEDIAMFRAILDSVVLHPCDALSTEKLVEAAARHVGISYLRTMRQATPVIYDAGESFEIGGSKVLRESPRDAAAVVAAGATVHEALEAHEQLKKEGIFLRVIDAYSIKPIDADTLRRAAREVKFIVTVEDHYAEGGLGESVLSALAGESVPVHVLAVRRMPRSGSPEELRHYEGISAAAIAARVTKYIH